MLPALTRLERDAANFLSFWEQAEYEPAARALVAGLLRGIEAMSAAIASRHSVKKEKAWNWPDRKSGHAEILVGQRTYVHSFAA